VLYFCWRCESIITFIPVLSLRLFASLFRRMLPRQLAFLHARHERFLAKRPVWSDEEVRENETAIRKETRSGRCDLRAVRGPPGAVFPRGLLRTWKRFNVIRIRISLKRLLPRAREHGQGSLLLSYRWRQFFARAQTRISAFCACTKSMRSYLLIMTGFYHRRYRLVLHRHKNSRTRSAHSCDKWQCARYEASALHTADRRQTNNSSAIAKQSWEIRRVSNSRFCRIRKIWLSLRSVRETLMKARRGTVWMTRRILICSLSKYCRYFF